MSCPSPSPCPACPHLELPLRCSSVLNVAADLSRSAASQAAGTAPHAPQSHPRAVVPVTSHQRVVNVIHPGHEGTTSSTPHCRPLSTTDDATPRSIVALCCSMDPEPAAPTPVLRHRHRSPLPKLPSPWTDLSVSLPTPYCSKLGSPLCCVALAAVPDPPRRRQPLKSAATAAPTLWGQPLLFLWPLSERPGGPKTLTGPA
jgi:hypothetical protein